MFSVAPVAPRLWWHDIYLREVSMYSSGPTAIPIPSFAGFQPWQVLQSPFNQGPSPVGPGLPQSCCPPQLYRVPERKSRSLGYGGQGQLQWGPFINCGVPLHIWEGQWGA